MGTRAWLNLGLLALVIALGTIAYLQPGREPAPEKPALVELSRSEVDRIRVAPRGGEPVVLERSGGSEWQMTVPRGMPADRLKVRTLLDLLGARSQGTVAIPEGKAGDFGLKEPELVLEMGGHRMALGGDHPIRYQRYIRVDDTVHLVNKGAASRLGSDWTAYAHRGLLPPGSEPVRIALPTMTLQKGEDGTWTAAETDADLEQRALKATVDAWRHRRALGIEALKGDPPKGEQVRVTLSNSEEPLTFVVAARKPELELVRPDLGLTYRLGKGAAPALLEPGKQPSPRPRPPGG